MPTSIRVYVPLVGGAADALLDLSRQEFRSPRDQAQKLIVEGLRAAGVLLPGPTDPASVGSREPARAAR